MRTVVPFDSRDPNSRLSAVLSPAERHEFAAAMLFDVLDAVRDAGGSPHVVASEKVTADVDAPVHVDDRPLSRAVGAAIDGPTAVVMSDLALASAAALSHAFSVPDTGEVAAAPGRGGGTNVLVVRHPDFQPDYHGTSFRDHQAAAAAVGARFRRLDSFRLAVDVDTPDDLVEVLLHGAGRSSNWLTDAGFDVAVDGGRATAVR